MCTQRSATEARNLHSLVLHSLTLHNSSYTEPRAGAGRFASSQEHSELGSHSRPAVGSWDSGQKSVVALGTRHCRKCSQHCSTSMSQQPNHLGLFHYRCGIFSTFWHCRCFAMMTSCKRVLWQTHSKLSEAPLNSQCTSLPVLCCSCSELACYCRLRYQRKQSATGAATASKPSEEKEVRLPSDSSKPLQPAVDQLFQEAWGGGAGGVPWLNNSPFTTAAGWNTKRQLEPSCAPAAWMPGSTAYTTHTWAPWWVHHKQGFLFYFPDHSAGWLVRGEPPSWPEVERCSGSSPPSCLPGFFIDRCATPCPEQEHLGGDLHVNNLWCTLEGVMCEHFLTLRGPQCW